MCLPLNSFLQATVYLPRRSQWLSLRSAVRVSVSCLVTALCFISPAIAKPSALGAIPKDVLADYRVFIDGRDPLEITSYGGQGARRDVIEVVLIQQALALGGYESPIGFLTVETYSRQLLEVKEGRAAFPFTSVWASDAQRMTESTVISDSLVESNEFVAGFYTTQDNLRALAARSVQQLAELKVVSNPKWKRDWQVLQSIMPKEHLYESSLWPSMVKMVHLGRVDFLLAPFQPTSDLSLDYEGIRLVPIPGIKISLGEGRRIVFSKSHSHGADLARAFDIGLQSMKESGLLHRAYTEAGFFNERVADWETLSSEAHNDL